jgi:hypothetical protein
MSHERRVTEVDNEIIIQDIRVPEIVVQDIDDDPFTEVWEE